MSHLDALNLRLSHERERLAAETTDEGRAMRKVWIAQIEKEISAEREFLGQPAAPEIQMSDDELLNALTE